MPIFEPFPGGPERKAELEAIEHDFRNYGLHDKPQPKGESEQGIKWLLAEQQRLTEQLRMARESTVAITNAKKSEMQSNLDSVEIRIRAYYRAHPDEAN